MDLRVSPSVNRRGVGGRTLTLGCGHRLKMLPVCLRVCDTLRKRVALPEQAIKLRVKKHQQCGLGEGTTLAFITNGAQATETNSPQASTHHCWIRGYG